MNQTYRHNSKPYHSLLIYPVKVQLFVTKSTNTNSWLVWVILMACLFEFHCVPDRIK